MHVLCLPCVSAHFEMHSLVVTLFVSIKAIGAELESLADTATIPVFSGRSLPVSCADGRGAHAIHDYIRHCIML